MVWSEYIDSFISFIKENLPPTHELLSHDLYPGIKKERELIFIVDDDTTGDSFLMDFTKVKSNKSTGQGVLVKAFKNTEEVQELIDQDHNNEFNK